ncbi:TGS domain-containing protein/RelA_SpoT domain-containing protein/HD_4 domain-containing protein [Cephalotus follicularis]|uniref:Putative GTP diphosphokinase RSH1, chloroplastic n=1 Tax=Cephalotus follicularis TaxID=3775 RepID=A0A1Q3AN76_CEPFO|nr:TGS domain-containing protein/RelA_SpoT domain-containing protein/HD_4 domain-containing protein [Cephalotus follicularis]
MASASSLSVPVECVNICKLLSKGEGSSIKYYECSVLSCAWKAPRVLSGFLATTAHPPPQSYAPNGSRNRFKSKYEAFDIGNFYPTEAVDIAVIGKLSRSGLLHVACKRWQLCSSSSSSSSDTFNDVSPDRLWEDLRPTISYLSPNELELVHNALKLAFEAHDGQKRRSGDPFIIHPVEVAHILGELELDWESIAAGLLHDTVEDTNVVTFERIEEEFGATVRRIVEGETKVSKLGKLKCQNENDSVQDVKADDLRQMFLAMTEEVRVIIVKLADRLHNMRTLSHMPQHKQSSIAMETLQVFAPLAKLLGMYQIKSELENLSFMYTSPEDYAKVRRRVADLYKEHEQELLEANKILMKKIEDDQFLDLMTVKTEVRSVCKEPYSVYKAVLKSKGSINEVNQIAQLRIIIKPKPCAGVGPLCSPQLICYHVLGLVHGIWTPIPRAMKDYIATPKPNGYQSLHTLVIPFLYESMFRLEVQIRTEEMDLIAERGIAAHYSGRVGVTGLVGHAMASARTSRGKTICLNNANIALRIGWLNAIREWQEEFVGNMSSREFVDTVTKDLLGSRIFVFTPRGEIKNLPKGATVIDYAYIIHTEIGNKMVAAKVNGNLVSPMHVLANAEVVEIITYNALSSKSAFQRHKQWLQHAKTRSARHKIMKFLREQAALSAAEITADTVNDFIADSEGESEAEELLNNSKRIKPLWEKIFLNVVELSPPRRSCEDPLEIKNGSVWSPKVNGKHNKNVQHVSLTANGDSFAQGSDVAKMIYANIPMYKDVLPSLESWQASKVASWHNLEGHSIQWFCVVCIDRRGMMAEITTVLSAAGITICSCVAEVDRGRGVAVMLFHVEANLDSLVDACISVDLILGVLGWSTGCSWPSIVNKHQFHEC